MEDLKWIKKHYGEEMMRLCRDNLAELFETEGLVPKLLDQNFQRNRDLASSIVREGKVADFKRLMLSSSQDTEKTSSSEKKSAKELLDEAGYILCDECLSHEEMFEFERFYEKGEVPNAIIDENRTERARVWFVLHKNVAGINRESFKEPSREDLYSQSVVLIHFNKKSKELYMQGRYGYNVANPFGLYNGNLDNMVPGLAEAFERDYGIMSESQKEGDFKLEGFTRASDGKYYGYDMVKDGIYYSAEKNLVIENGEVKQLPQHQMLVGVYVFDLKENKVSAYDDKEDGFTSRVFDAEKIEYTGRGFVVKCKNGKVVVVNLDDKKQIQSVDSSDSSDEDEPNS